VLIIINEMQNWCKLKRAKIIQSWEKYSGDFVSEDAFLEIL